nr:unnamed protein product [Callosobruchus chinensis]
MPPNRTTGAKVRELWRGHPANRATCRFAPRKKLQVI